MNWELIQVKKQLRWVNPQTKKEVVVDSGTYWKSSNNGSHCHLVTVFVSWVSFNSYYQRISHFIMDETLVNNSSIFIRTADSLQSKVLDDCIKGVKLNNIEFQIINFKQLNDKKGGVPATRVGVMASLTEGTPTISGIISSNVKRKKFKRKK